MTEDQFNFRYLMDKLSDRMIAFLNNELAIETININRPINSTQKMQLNYLTSLINVEGNIKMFVTFSYDEGLFNEIFTRYTADLSITDDEQAEAIVDSAGDIINIIVGNTLADISETNQKITMSPPIVITDAKQIACQRQSLFYKAELMTEYGKLDIYLVNSLTQDRIV